MDQKKITTQQELDRVHLRFLKVTDDKKLSDILFKLLPNILSVYFEIDFENVAAFQDNGKFKALEEIMAHLLMRVQNSKGAVKVPMSKLFDIFSSPAYTSFQNQNMKSHAKNRIFDFVFAQYPFMIGQDLSVIVAEVIKPIVKALPLLDDATHEKSTLLIFLLDNMVRATGTTNKEQRAFAEALQQIIAELCPESKAEDVQIDSGKEAGEEPKRELNKYHLELLSCFFNFICVFQQPGSVKSPQMAQHLEQTLAFVHDNFKDKTAAVQEPVISYQKNCMLAILKTIDSKELFPVQQYTVPMVALMTMHDLGEVAEAADSALKAYLQDFDRNDSQMVHNLFRVVQNENIYRQADQGGQDPQAEQLIYDVPNANAAPQTPILTMKKLVDILMKFDASAQADQGPNVTKLIDACIKNKASMLHTALQFIVHVIKSCRDLQAKSSEEEHGISMIQRLLNHLMAIRGLKIDGERDLFQQLSQAQVYVCLADLARHDHSQVFNPTSLSLSMLSIEAFEALQYRIQQIESIKPIRDDELCLVYLEALNKFRDIVDERGRQDSMINQEKQIVLKLVIKILNKQLLSIVYAGQLEDSAATNSEMIYILFLFLASLDKRYDDKGTQLPNPSILFYATSLKEHPDIKIRKEAGRQIELFDQQIEAYKASRKELAGKVQEDGDVEMSADINEELMQQISAEAVRFFERNNVPISLEAEQLLEFLTLSNYQNFQANNFTPSFIEQCTQVSKFYLAFYQETYMDGSDGQAPELPSHIQILPRLLLMNLNLNFTKLKADFFEPITMLKQLIKDSQKRKASFPVLETISMPILYKHMTLSTNLDQKILAFRTIARLAQVVSAENSYFLLKDLKPEELAAQDPLIGKESHEGLLNTLMRLTLLLIFLKQSQQDEGLAHRIYAALGQEMAKTAQAVEQSMTPNVKQTCRLLITCVNLVAKFCNRDNSGTSEDESQLFKQAASLIFEVLKKKDNETGKTDNNGQPVSVVNTLNAHLIKSLYQIVVNVNQEAFTLQTCDQVLRQYLAMDATELQSLVGRFLAKALKAVNDGDESVTAYAIHFLMKFVKASDKNVTWTFTKAESDQITDAMSVDYQHEVTLSSKRVCILYLYEVLQLYGGEPFVRDRFVVIQKIFLKYIFDMKPLVQEVSSKALTQIYKLGDESVKEQLVQALSATLTADETKGPIAGESNEDKVEDRELLLDFSAQQSAEQRKRFRTYKDLCRIAVEIGQKDMIYQFMEVHRHLTHYQDVKKAAAGLSSIIMLDDRLKEKLLRIAPKIYMLTFDYNQEVRDTMRQLWATLVAVDEEAEVLESKWPDILTEALEGMKQKEFRKRLSAALVLCDLVPNRKWVQIKDKFGELFLGSLALLDDDVEAVKKAANELTKANKTLVLKFANIYNNNDLEELQEVLDLVIPMVINDVIKSNMKAVKFYGVNLLFQIVKSSTQERMYQNLKIQNKYERQLAFSYNSEQKMKEILNKYLGDIILNVLQNLSVMNDAVEKINQIEQYAISKGFYTESGGSSRERMQISEADINRLRVKYTKDSEWGEILAICRKQMYPSTFDQILPELLNLMVKGHDMITKSTAVVFVQDILLDNKLDLITPKNSRKIAQRLIDIYSQNSVQTCLQLKPSVIHLYAGCLGLLFKIIKNYPQTTQQLIAQVVELPEELEHIKLVNLLEIILNVPAEQLRTGGADGQVLVKAAIPMIYINRYSNDPQMKNVATRTWRYVNEQMVEASDQSYLQNHQLEIQNSEAIMGRILQLFDSNSYDDRISAGLAMEELCSHLQAEDVASSPAAQKIIDKLFQLISSKYFVKKEVLLESFSRIVELMEGQSPFLKGTQLTKDFISTIYLKQIEKFINQNLAYKNQLMFFLNNILARAKQNQAFMKELEEQLIDVASVILVHIQSGLEQVRDNTSLQEGNVSSFDEKKTEEKQGLLTINALCEQFAHLWMSLPRADGESFHSQFADICRGFYSFTNFFVRNAFLKAMNQVIKAEKAANKNVLSPEALGLADFVLEHTAKQGEKYDVNLELLSEITLQVSANVDIPAALADKLSKNSAALIEVLKEKGTESLQKNVDLISVNFAL